MVFFLPACREFYYIQMEKYARQAVQEGVKTVEDLMVGNDSEIFRVLNLHYNRNNHIEVWNQVRTITHEHTLNFFFLFLSIFNVVSFFFFSFFFIKDKVAFSVYSL